MAAGAVVVVAGAAVVVGGAVVVDGVVAAGAPKRDMAAKIRLGVRRCTRSINIRLGASLASFASLSLLAAVAKRLKAGAGAAEISSEVNQTFHSSDSLVVVVVGAGVVAAGVVVVVAGLLRFPNKLVVAGAGAGWLGAGSSNGDQRMWMRGQDETHLWEPQKKTLQTLHQAQA